MTRRAATAGITLLELLLSVAIMAMIAVGLGSLFDTGARVWQRLDTDTAFADRAVNRSEFRRHLENMPVVTIDAPLSEIFRETETGFDVQIMREGDPVWLEVRLDPPVFLLRDASGTRTLRSGLTQTALLYYGRKTVRDDFAWHNNWRDATILPVLIKIETWDADGVANPPLTVQPGKLTRQMEISLSSLVPPN